MTAVAAPESIVGASEVVDEFLPFGIRAFTTTRQVGTFGLLGADPVHEVSHRWAALRRELRPAAPRLATAAQVHGAAIAVHDRGWSGWLRVDDADGHVSMTRGIALAVTVADCVPVLVAHPSGAIAALHAGWRGTAAGILPAGLHALAARGVPTGELHVHLGPAICGACYEFGADVYLQLTGRDPGRATTVDVRAILADQARAAGVRHLTVSSACTRCDGERFFSHRAGDAGRQLGVIASDL
jgi:polyphenol oxidase